MSDDVKAKLEERKVALEAEFNALGEELQKLVEQGKTLNRRVNEIQARQVEIRGGFQEVNSLLGDEPKEVPVEEPKKKK